MSPDPHSLHPQPGPPVPGADPVAPPETKGYRLNHTMVSPIRYELLLYRDLN